LRVDEELAELGVVTLTTARAPTPRDDVTSAEGRLPALLLRRGLGGCFFPREIG